MTFIKIQKKTFPHLVLTSIIYICIFIIYYNYFINDHPSKELQIQAFEAWDKVFMPRNFLKMKFYIFNIEKAWMIVTSLFKYGIIGGIFLLFLILIGILDIYKKGNFGMIILIITPFLLHLVLSSLKLYPFEKRFVLYTFPIIIINLSFGFNYLVNSFHLDFAKIHYKVISLFIPLVFFYFFYKTVL